ncbi:MAG: chemotaxis protein CheY [Verrucomicrobiales bacterium]|nr:chemotaxis protein CheY [Verrucomicrobiales bacterium]MDB6130223.1 chemotaxis protein CheY [Verrucomicrobiales bacterium]
MKQRIFVIDDEVPICELLTKFFSKRGYEVSTAHSAEAARVQLADQSFDLTILDVLLPDTDGLVFLESIKRMHPNMPIVIMTGIGFDEELLQESIQKGASGYISKTLPLDQLLMEVHRILKPVR